MAEKYQIIEKRKDGLVILHPETDSTVVKIIDEHGVTTTQDTNVSALLNAVAELALQGSTAKTVEIANLGELDTYKTPGIYRILYDDSPFHLFTSQKSTNYIVQVRTSKNGYHQRIYDGTSFSDWVYYLYSVNGRTMLEANTLYSKGAIITTSGGVTYLSLIDNNSYNDFNDTTKWFNLSTLKTELGSKASQGFVTSTFVAKNSSTAKSEVGLGNVTNDAQVKRSEMGIAGGVATLDNDGKVPSSQLPSYVDDVVEHDTFDDFPTTGEEGKIYVAIDTNITYRWSGTQYTEISSSLALGETAGTAYEGSKGKLNAQSIADLEERMESAESDISGLNGRLAQAEESIEAIGGDFGDRIDGLETRMDDVENVSNTNTSEITKIKNGTTKVASASQADSATTATSASKLTNPIAISLAGDASGGSMTKVDLSQNFSLNVVLNSILSNDSQSFQNVIVNRKGLVTGGTQLIEIGAEGQETPSASLGVGGLFFKRLS